MMKKSIMVLALQAGLGLSFLAGSGSVLALDDAEVAAIRTQIKEMRESYEARLQALEQRLQEVQNKNKQLEANLAATPPAPVVAPVINPASLLSGPSKALNATNQFNPAVSLILNGTATRLTQDPERYRLQGFIPGGAERVGLEKRGFSLGESELTLSSAIDPYFAGQLTLTYDGEGAAEVEEGFIQTLNLGKGLGLKAGRVFSGFGYQNSQHAHVWDFSDLPLAYEVLLGGQTATNGVQLKWLLPTDRFLELGVELGNGTQFPAAAGSRNGIGSSVIFAHIGDDIGQNGSYRAGLSYLRSRANDRLYEDDGGAGSTVMNAFSGRSDTVVADGVLKFAFSGQRSFKLQGEYIYRIERGTLAYDVQNATGAGPVSSYRSGQGGYYLQGIYQPNAEWRTGLRYDRLMPGSQRIGAVTDGRLTADNFPLLGSYRPTRTGVMFEWNGSEFSRLRLQLARDKPSPSVIDNQIIFQYIMSLGAHGAHTF
jgi:hypothetical protein